MLELKTKKELSTAAHRLARGFSMVRHRGITYIPADYETGATDTPPEPERTMWLPLNKEAIQLMAAEEHDILFASDSELSSFNFMVAQYSTRVTASNTSLLLRTPEGLVELRPDGKLHVPSGEFVANTLHPMLQQDPEHKQRVFDVIAEWLDSEEEAHSLLRHFATALAPGWSAVKYVLMLGEGRNGKGLLLKMLHSVFGRDNVSSVSRQQIAEESPVVCELNNKLLNIVYDGKKEYVKDSGMEKTLIAGEPATVRRLYESTPTVVQTNALFVESLNSEPKSTDKSVALQKRLVRYHFPNVYPLDHRFERVMLSPESLGALLALLIDHYVLEDEVAESLAPSQKAVELQLEHMFINSLGLQFLKYLEETDPLGHEGLLDSTMTELAQAFSSWRIKENDVSTWAEPDVATLFQPLIDTDRKSVRDANGKPRKKRVVTAFKPEALAFLATLMGDEDDVLAEAVRASDPTSPLTKGEHQDG